MDKQVKEKLWRVLLRYMPLFPAPELVDLIAQIRRSQTDMDTQVAEAVESIQRTSELVSRLEDSLKERAEKLEKLREQHEHFSRLAKVESEKAEPLLAEIEATLSKGRTKERWVAFLINIAAGIILFVLGVVFSNSMKRWLEMLFDWIASFSIGN